MNHTLDCMSVPNVCDYSCICKEGWQGKDCNEQRNECQDNPCVHGTCYDLEDGYYCTCKDGYGGRQCEVDLDMCRDNPCYNGATCETVNTSPTERSFQCNCTQYYQGPTCEDRKPPCSISPCGDNGFCFTKQNEEFCYCNEGYEGSRCETEIDECESIPCKNGGLCVDGIGNYNCICEPGYGGKNCTLRRDPCSQQSNLCKNGGVCSECEDNSCQRRYSCSCLSGWTGYNCSINIDDCAFTKTNEGCLNGAKCIDKIDAYECFCADGYEGEHCEININECDPNPCWYQFNCTDLVADYQCDCVGTSGKNCEEDIDECSDGTAKCQNGGDCVNIPRSYECKCPPGFGGKDCEREIRPCDSEPCQNMGQCSDVDTLTYSCDCMGGYTGTNCSIESPVCEQFECNAGTCFEIEGKPTCKCDLAHSGDACQIELCAENTCKNKGSCMNTPEGFKCSCNLPFVGDNCQDRVKVLRLTQDATAIVPIGSQDEKSLKLNMGLKVDDAVSEQLILSHNTDSGIMELKIIDGMVQLLLRDEFKLSVPIRDETILINVILEENYVQLKAGNESSVHVYDSKVNPIYEGQVTLGSTMLTQKRSTARSFTGCVIGLVNDVSIIEGHGFAECEDSYDECENGGVRVESVCQCIDGFIGSKCQIEDKDSCNRISCPGKCRETSFGPECICDWPTYGEMCSNRISIPSFSADSSIEFQIDNTDSVYLLFDFKPHFPKGFISTVMNSKRNMYISSYLDDSHVYFKIKVHDAKQTLIKIPSKVMLKEWNMLYLVLSKEYVYISLSGASSLYNTFSATLFDFDTIVFGNQPYGVDDGLENLPGFFGEILPLHINGKPNWEQSKGISVVEYDDKISRICSPQTCGKGNKCFDTSFSYYCLCRSSSGQTCEQPVQQLAFLGTGYTQFNQKNDINMLDLSFRIKPLLISRESILLSAVSKLSTKLELTATLTLDTKGYVTAMVMDLRNDTKYVMKSNHSLDFNTWSTVSFTLAPQKMSLDISPSTLPTITRFRFGSKLFTSLRPKIFFGRTKQKETVSDNLDGFVGHLSKLELNKKSILNSLTEIEKSVISERRSPCGSVLCGKGVCVEDNTEEFHCECNNDVQQGLYCNETVSFGVISMKSTGSVNYMKSFQQGDLLKIKFSLSSFTLKDSFLRIRKMFTNKGNDVEINLDAEGSFLWGKNAIKMDTNQVLELSIKRKQSYLELRYQDDVFESPIEAEDRLEKVIRISFVGQLYEVTMNEAVLNPVEGFNLTEGSYPACYENPCINGGVCTDIGSDNFTCKCQDGFTGRYCNMLIDLCSDTSCNATSECISVNGISFYCKPCPEGYRGLRCEEKAFCELLKPCSFLGDTVGNCTETSDGYTCDCGDGKQRSDCDLKKTCDDIECLNDGICVEAKEGVRCECPDIFTGKFCQNILDNCLPKSPCLNGGECISETRIGEYFCICPQEFTGKHCEERLDPCIRNPCFNNGTCHSNENDSIYECRCEDGYFGDNCESSNCDNNMCYKGDCVPNAINYTCNCQDGFGGSFCNIDVNECEDIDMCTQQGVCSNNYGGYDCNCFSGFEGKNCEINIPDCMVDSCNGNGLCIDGYNNFTCLCDQLYTGQYCDVPLDMCDPNPCKNEAQCYNYGVDYFCVCAPGYEGRNCTMDTDACKYNRCEHDSTCIDQVSGYNCSCLDGYTGRFCEDDINECDNSPCKNSGKCINIDGSFQCLCPKYYDGPNCETVLSECYDDPCKNGGSCKEMGTAGEGRICLCPEGWKGVNCTERISECESSRCLNGGDCVVESTGNQCVCKYPHFGTFCEEKVFVPAFVAPDSYLTVLGSSVDLIEGIQFRILPSSAGVILSLQFSEQIKSISLNLDSSGLMFASVLYAESDVPQNASMGKILLHQWGEIHLNIDENVLTVKMKANGSVINSESFGIGMAGATLTQLRFGKPETILDAVSFGGAIYDFQDDFENIADSKMIEQSNSSNLCSHGNGGKCGEKGVCFKEMCLCPLQKSGNACQQDLAFPSPLFAKGEGYVQIDDIDKESWHLELSVHGIGDFLYGVDDKEIVFRSYVGEDFISFKGRDIEEVVRWKGSRPWTNLDISSDGYRITISIHGAEMLEIIINNPIVTLYIGGMEGEGYFKGTIAKIALNGRAPNIVKKFNVFESNLNPCDNDPCMNNRLTNREAKCISDHLKPQEYRCICPTGLTGKYCQNEWANQTPKFNVNSYIKFRRDLQYSGKELSLKLVLKITEKNFDTKYLFSTSSLPGVPDFLHVYIKRSKVHVAFDLGDDIAITKTPQKVDDGQWHFVHLTLRGRHLMLMVDRRVSEAIAPGPSSVLNVGNYFYLGTPEAKLKSFVGCIESLTIDNNILTMMDSVETVDIDFCGDAIPETSIYNFKYRL